MAALQASFVGPLHLLGDGSQMRLEINDRLGGTNEIVDLPAQEGGKLENLVGLGEAIPLLDGDVRGTAAPEELRNLLLRLATGFAGLGDPLAQNPGVERVRLRHGSLLARPVGSGQLPAANEDCYPSRGFHSPSHLPPESRKETRLSLEDIIDFAVYIVNP